MKESDIFREYARVVDMCEGTAVMPYHCVHFNGKDFDPNLYNSIGVPALLACDPVARGEVEFAVCIIENKPVFRLDRLYVIRTGEGLGVGAIGSAIHDNETMIHGHCDDGTQCWFNTESLTWNKPKPKTITVTIPKPLRFDTVVTSHPPNTGENEMKIPKLYTGKEYAGAMHEKEEPVRLVPTMQLRWVIGHKFSMVGNMSPNPVMILQQWFKAITTPDAAGHYPHGEWIIVPTEGMQ